MGLQPIALLHYIAGMVFHAMQLKYASSAVVLLSGSIVMPYQAHAPAMQMYALPKASLLGPGFNQEILKSFVLTEYELVVPSIVPAQHGLLAGLTSASPLKLLWELVSVLLFPAKAFWRAFNHLEDNGLVSDCRLSCSCVTMMHGYVDAYSVSTFTKVIRVAANLSMTKHHRICSHDNGVA